MKIYLDTCVYNRPFDDQSDERIFMEAQGFIVVLKKVEEGDYDLVVSSVNLAENEHNPFPERRDLIRGLFNLAKGVIRLKHDDLIRAEQLEGMGFRGLDALHIAVCERAQVDYLITCDDRLLRSYRNNRHQIKVRVINVLNFIEEVVFGWD